MRELLFQLTFVSVLFLAASTQPTGILGLITIFIIVDRLQSFLFLSIKQSIIVQLFLEKEMILDLSSGTSKNHQVAAVNEWIIETDPNHIFYFSLLANENVDEKLISSSLTVLIKSINYSPIFPSFKYAHCFRISNVHIFLFF